MERLTSKKNATGEWTGRTVGSWHVAFRCAMRKDASLGGTGRTPILKIESMPKRSCDVSPDNFCSRRTKSDGESRGSCMTRRAKTSSLWQQCLVNSVIQFLRSSENHVGFFPSVRCWRTGASEKSARFLTYCTRQCYTRKEAYVIFARPKELNHGVEIGRAHV